MFRSNAYTADDRDTVIAKLELLADAIARQAAQPDTLIELAAALDQCATRFERALIANGTEPDFAALAVADYRSIINHTALLARQAAQPDCGDLVAVLEEIGREQGAINATIAADKFQSLARKAIAAHKAKEPKT